ncbi:TPA: hypothetical protein QDZ47_002283 [Stenotrophomonas maltophilia]|nr:hypothetical protein [Stenotrophomonas maltophilia]
MKVQLSWHIADAVGCLPKWATSRRIECNGFGIDRIALAMDQWLAAVADIDDL